jgi:hypothetical protein
MTFTDFIYATGDVLESSFKVLPLIGNNFNYIVIVLGFVGLAYWLTFQLKKTKQAKRDGTYV